LHPIRQDAAGLWRVRPKLVKNVLPAALTPQPLTRADLDLDR
jgi:hypothetical protein